MEYVECKDTDFKLLYKKLTPTEVKHYIFEALKVCREIAHTPRH